MIDEMMDVVGVILDEKAPPLFEASVAFLLCENAVEILASRDKTSSGRSMLVILSEVSDRLKSHRLGAMGARKEGMVRNGGRISAIRFRGLLKIKGLLDHSFQGILSGVNGRKLWW